jgi:hypothetical protein
LLAESNDLISNAMGLPNLQLSQITMFGNLDMNSMSLSSFEISCLAIFGEDCFSKEGKEGRNDVDFKRENCFYANSNLKLDLTDFSNNYLQGYFHDVNMRHLLKNFLHFTNDMNLIESTSRHIIDLNFQKGADILYSKKPHHSEQGVMVVPSGITINGASHLLGLDGRLLLNVNEAQGQIHGVFHFVIFFYFFAFYFGEFFRTKHKKIIGYHYSRTGEHNSL